MWINVWVTGKTVWSLVNTCQPEHFRDKYRAHYKALYKCPVYLLACLLTCLLQVCNSIKRPRFVLTEYFSAEGKTKVGMMFASDGGQPYVEITKTVIRVCWKYTYVRLSVQRLAFSAFDTVGWASGWASGLWKIESWDAGMVVSGARCKWVAYGSIDATATTSSLSSLKSRLV